MSSSSLFLSGDEEKVAHGRCGTWRGLLTRANVANPHKTHAIAPRLNLTRARKPGHLIELPKRPVMFAQSLGEYGLMASLVSIVERAYSTVTGVIADPDSRLLLYVVGFAGLAWMSVRLFSRR
jgi:hypothetical protein